MKNFLTNPFGDSFAGRVYTKVAKSAAGDTSYSALNPEKNNKTSIGQALSSNDKFAAFRDSGDDTKSADWNRRFSDSATTDTTQTTQQPSTWQKIKTSVSNWWNGNNSQQKLVTNQTFHDDSTAVDKVCTPSSTIDATTIKSGIQAE